MDRHILFAHPTRDIATAISSDTVEKTSVLEVRIINGFEMAEKAVAWIVIPERIANQL